MQKKTHRVTAPDSRPSISHPPIQSQKRRARAIDNRYQPTILKRPESTSAKEVAKNVEAVAFSVVRAVEEEGTWVFWTG